MKRASGGEELALVRYVGRVTPLDDVDETLRRVGLQWATADFAEEEHDVEKKRGAGDTMVADECFGAVPFRSTVSMVLVVRTNTAMCPFTREVAWSSRGLYTNSFFRKCVLKKARYMSRREFRRC